MTKYIFITINKVCLPLSNKMQPFVCKKSAQYNITKPNSNKNKKSKYKRSELRGIVKGGFPSQPMLKTCGKPLATVSKLAAVKLSAFENNTHNITPCCSFALQQGATDVCF